MKFDRQEMGGGPMCEEEDDFVLSKDGKFMSDVWDDAQKQARALALQLKSNQWCKTGYVPKESPDHPGYFVGPFCYIPAPKYLTKISLYKVGLYGGNPIFVGDDGCLYKPAKLNDAYEELYMSQLKAQSIRNLSVKLASLVENT